MPKKVAKETEEKVVEKDAEVKALAEGDKAPDFTLVDQDNQKVKLSQFKGKNVVLYFYPKDLTPGCTKEACSFRDFNQEFEELNTVILGVSKDSWEKHSEFRKKYALPFILLSDVDGKVCKKYGILKDKSMFGKTFLGIERTTFLIDEKGKIRKIFPKVKVDKHVDKVLDEIKAMK